MAQFAARPEVPGAEGHVAFAPGKTFWIVTAYEQTTVRTL
jgi:hypothetical protein